MRTPGWIDQAKGLVRLRVEDAMKIVEREWGERPRRGPFQPDRPRGESDLCAAPETERIRVSRLVP